MLLRTIPLFFCVSLSLCATLSLLHMREEETPAPHPTPGLDTVVEAMDGNIQDSGTIADEITNNASPPTEEESLLEKIIGDEKQPEVDQGVQEFHAATEDVVPTEEVVNESDSKTQTILEANVIQDKIEANVIQDKIEDSVSQDKLEDSVSQDKLEDSVSQDKLEDSVIQDKTEDSVIQDKLEDSVIQDKTEDSVIQDKTEDSVIQDKTEDSVIQDKIEDNVIQDQLPQQDKEIMSVQTEEVPKQPEEQKSRWSLGSIRNTFQNMNGYFDSLVELVGGKDGVCQYRCRYGEVPGPRPGYQLPKPNGCSSSLVGFQLDLGIPAMTQCCNQLDSCYDTCGTSKYDCDSSFRTCLHGICSDFKKSLGLDTQYQTCESMADGLFNTVWTLGCRPYMNSQRAACICEEEERDEL